LLPRGREIVLARADGSGERTAVQVDAGGFVLDAALSPDGSKVALGLFTSPAGGRPVRLGHCDRGS
jgi:hypothetical protein